jgi:Putative Ig domain
VQYAFTPNASDPNGNALTYSITNRPSWATFNASSGRLAGTPTSANVGTYSNIVIRVSDGQATAQLPAFAIVVSSAPNRPPVISGAPPTSVTPGSVYAFQPTASDPDGNPLTFSITNAPSWATFNATTGRLQGTPSAADVGTYNNIVIRVSDASASTGLPAFGIMVVVVATGSATVSWTPPTTNTDGSPLTNLAGYRVRWGPAAGNYPNSVTLNNAGLTSYVVGNLVPGTYYFVVTALNSTGAESQVSNMASKTIP